MLRRSRNLGRMPLGWNAPTTLPSGPIPFLLKLEDLLHADHVFFHAGDLVDTDHLAASITHAGDLNYHGYGGGHLLAYCSFPGY